MDFLYETYEGKEPYIFVSYSHQDSQLVLPLIQGLQKKGFRVWYDAGIEVGAEWPEYIAEHLYACDCVLAFISPNAIASPNCRQEINYAIDLNKKTVAVYLENMELSKGMQMRLGAIQAIYYPRFTNQEAFLNSLVKADVLEASWGGQETDQKEQPVRAVIPEKVTAEKPNPKAKINWKKYWIPAVAAVLAVVLLIALVGRKLEEPAAQGDPVQQTQEDAAQQTQAAAQPAAPQEKLSNVLMENPVEDYKMEADEPFFNMQVLRKEVGTVTFLDTLADAPADAADVSLAQDGGVKAWAVKNGELYDVCIAADGGVYAPAKADNLFRSMSNLTEIHFGDAFYTDKAESMAHMFSCDESLRSLDVSGFNTENVTFMCAMFQLCKNLESLDVRGFQTGQVTDMSWMFQGCEKLKNLNLSGISTQKVMRFSSMFQDCKNLESLDVSGFITAEAKDMSGMFKNCSTVKSLNVKDFNTAHVADMREMFSGCAGLKELDFSNFNTAQVQNMEGMFCKCTGLVTLDLSSFKTPQVKSMYSMFYDCNSLKELDIRNFDTSNVKSMYCMFYGCSSLETLDLKHFDTSLVENMDNMFLLCSSLQELDVSGFETGKVKSMMCMFNRCSSLKELDVSGFNTEQVTNMEHMFSDCSNLEKLDVSKFKTGNVTNFYCMFYNCGCAADADVTKFDVSKAEKYDFFLPDDVQVKGKPWKEMFA